MRIQGDENKNTMNIEASKNKIGYKYQFDWKTEDQLLPAAKRIFKISKGLDQGINATIILSLTSAIEGLIKLAALKKKGINDVYCHKYKYKDALKDLYSIKDLKLESDSIDYFINFFNTDNKLNFPINILFEFRNHIAHGKALEFHFEKFVSQTGISNSQGLKKEQNKYKTYENVLDYTQKEELGDDIFAGNVINHFIEKTEQFFIEFKVKHDIQII